MRMEETGEPIIDPDAQPPAYDDFATLWQWLTFTWVSPVISIGELFADASMIFD